MNELWQGLKQRKLVQWALAYLAGAWALLQVLGLAADSYDWPHLVMRLSFAVIALGFVVMLVLAWYHGERGAQRVSGIELSILALLLALGGGFVWRFERAPPAVMAPATSASVAASANVPAVPTTVSAKSIAVLPFENLSDEKGNAYFASGMQDMILTRLADIGDLKVISRTSTAKYTSHPDDLKAIAQQLGVATILEGSVQKAGNQVLINVQLIDAQTDNHLWAEAYSRTLDNIFGVEGEVAQKVAEALKVKLQPAKTTQLTAQSTTDPAAFDDYLRAGHYMFAAEAGDWAKALPQAIDAYRRAITQDPKFALAWAGLSFAQSFSNYVGLDRSAARMRAAEENAGRALVLAPDLPEAHVAMGYVYRFGHRDYEAARTEYQLALQERPNDADTIAAIAYIDMIGGKSKAGLEGLERAIALDPRDATTATQLSRGYNAIGDYTRAAQALARALAVNPLDAEAYAYLSRSVVLATGDTQHALEVLDSMPAGTPTNHLVIRHRINLLLYRRDFIAARQVAATLADRSGANTLASALAQGDVEWLAGAPARARPFYLAAADLLRAQLATDADDAGAHADLSLAYARLGRAADARNEGGKAIAIARRQGDRAEEGFDLVELAKIEVATGDGAAAIGHLDQARAGPVHGVLLSAALLKLDPVWDPIRDDPRFRKLIADGEKTSKEAAP